MALEDPGLCPAAATNGWVHEPPPASHWPSEESLVLRLQPGWAEEPGVKTPQVTTAGILVLGTGLSQLCQGSLPTAQGHAAAQLPATSYSHASTQHVQGTGCRPRLRPLERVLRLPHAPALDAPLRQHSPFQNCAEPSLVMSPLMHRERHRATFPLFLRTAPQKSRGWGWADQHLSPTFPRPYWPHVPDKISSKPGKRSDTSQCRQNRETPDRVTRGPAVSTCGLV